jgi:hypothetical protein
MKIALGHLGHLIQYYLPSTVFVFLQAQISSGDAQRVNAFFNVRTGVMEQKRQ